MAGSNYNTFEKFSPKKKKKQHTTWEQDETEEEKKKNLRSKRKDKQRYAEE